MIKNPFAGFDFSNPFGTDAMKRSRNLFGVHTTPRDWKHGARDIPFGMGAQPLHVDGTKGNDSNDGESWVTAKKTIQGTVDAADSWTNIFIKAGTYAENVTIATDAIQLIGQSRDSVEIKPSTGVALTISNSGVGINSLSTIANEALWSVEINGAYCALSAVKVEATTISARGIHISASNCVLNEIYANDSLMVYGIRAEAGLVAGQVKNSYMNLTKNDAYIIVLAPNATNIQVFGNTLIGSYKGVATYSGATNTVFHNNFNSINTPISGADCHFFENFYSNHTNVDNGFGIATEPFSYDSRPVIVENGWNSISILRSLLRKKTAIQTSQAATDANGTAWVDLKSIAPTTSDIELHRLKMTTAGSWAGTAKYRIIIGATKVYPFPADKNIDSGNIEDLIFPINVQINETCKIQFRSDNAGDGAGETVALNQLDYATAL